MADATDRQAALQRATVFAGVQDEDLRRLSVILLLKQYAAGERIFNLGDDARTMLIIASGTIGLTLPLMIRGVQDEVELEEKDAGAVIAWSALVPPHKYTLSARAKTAVELYCFERDTLNRYFDEFPHIRLAVTTNLNMVIASRVTMLEALVVRNLQRWVSEKYA